MSFGATLFRLRREAGLSQEELAEKLDVTRQTVSKWEMDLSTPDITRLQAISKLFGVTYEALIGESGAVTTDWNTMEAMAEQLDWTAAWAVKYPILATYPQLPGINRFAEQIHELFTKYKDTYQMNDRDTVLVLKDLLFKEYKHRKQHP